MAVRIRSTTYGNLRLTLSNNGEVLDTQLAATPQEANRIGIMMLASRDELNAGDTLSCRHADQGREANLVPGPGGGR